MATNQNGQDKNPDHSDTLGNALTEYQSPPTSQPQQPEVKTTWLPDVASRICDGNYVHEYLEQAHALLQGHKTGNLWQVLVVWIYFASHADQTTGQVWHSQGTAAARIGQRLTRETVSRNIDVLVLCGAMTKLKKQREGNWVYVVSADLHQPDVSNHVSNHVSKRVSKRVGNGAGNHSHKQKHKHSTPTPQMNGGDDDDAAK